MRAIFLFECGSGQIQKNNKKIGIKTKRPQRRTFCFLLIK